MKKSIQKPRACGSCTVCCKTHYVFEFNKPPGEWCTHCMPGRGCKIYTTNLPEGCRQFKCEWLKGSGTNNERPDHTGVVLDYFHDKFMTDPSVGQVMTMWEVVEGTLQRPFARRKTLENLNKGIFVAHHAVSNRWTLFVPPNKTVHFDIAAVYIELGIQIRSWQ